MNIIIDHSQLKPNNVCFAEKKKNIIIDGTFTKIIYSNENVCMNGIFLYFPVIVALHKNGGNVGTSAGQTNGNVRNSVGMVSGKTDAKCIRGEKENWSHSPEYGNTKSKYISAYPAKLPNKQIIDVDVGISHNNLLFNVICAIETEILSQYKQLFGVNKHIAYTLRNQVMTGSICVSGNEHTYHNGEAANPAAENTKPIVGRNDDNYQYVLKISGIWESPNAIGITYKFIRMRKFAEKVII